MAHRSKEEEATADEAPGVSRAWLRICRVPQPLGHAQLQQQGFAMARISIVPQSIDLHSTCPPGLSRDSAARFDNEHFRFASTALSPISSSFFSPAPRSKVTTAMFNGTRRIISGLAPGLNLECSSKFISADEIVLVPVNVLHNLVAEGWKVRMWLG